MGILNAPSHTWSPGCSVLIKHGDTALASCLNCCWGGTPLTLKGKGAGASLMTCEQELTRVW